MPRQLQASDTWLYQVQRSSREEKKIERRERENGKTGEGETQAREEHTIIKACIESEEKSACDSS